MKNIYFIFIFNIAELHWNYFIVIYIIIILLQAFSLVVNKSIYFVLKKYVVPVDIDNVPEA